MIMGQIISQKRFEEVVKNFDNVDPIVVFGDVGVDKYIYGDVHKISPEAPVPVLEVSKEWYKLGLAANVADNIAGLQVKSTLASVIGEDNNAKLLKDLLRENHIDDSGIIQDQDRITTFKERAVTKFQQICRIDYEDKKKICSATEDRLIKAVDKLKEDHCGVIIEDYGKGVVTEKACKKIINFYKEAKRPIAVDPGKLTPPLWYKGATILKPNLVESKSMARSLGYLNEDNLETIADILVEKLELSVLLISLGDKGMAFMDRENGGKLNIIPTMATEVFDVSGAGDTVISTICISLLAGASVEEACWMANLAAGVVVGKKGTAKVTREELRQFYKFMALKLSMD